VISDDEHGSARLTRLLLTYPRVVAEDESFRSAQFDEVQVDTMPSAFGDQSFDGSGTA